MKAWLCFVSVTACFSSIEIQTENVQIIFQAAFWAVSVAHL